MAARAELLRNHAFEIAGLAVPPHAVPPAPVITVVGVGGVIAWRGSAGAVKYTIERQDSASSPWRVVDSNATDADTPWVDPNPPAGLTGGIYCVLFAVAFHITRHTPARQRARRIKKCGQPVAGILLPREI